MPSGPPFWVHAGRTNEAPYSGRRRSLCGIKYFDAAFFFFQRRQVAFLSKTNYGVQDTTPTIILQHRKSKSTVSQGRLESCGEARDMVWPYHRIVCPGDFMESGLILGKIPPFTQVVF